jgi:hypothetical protein
VPLPGGAIVPVSLAGTRLLATCCMRCDLDGTICATLTDLARASGRCLRTTAKAMAELVAGGLVHRSGKTRGIFRYVDPKLLKTLRLPASRRTHDDGWRELRARCGGLERALRAAQRRVESTQQQIEHTQARLAQMPAVADGVDVAWLFRELRHSSDCTDPDCERCLEASRVLEDDDIDVKAEVLEQLDEAAALKTASRAVVEAARAQGVGAMARRAEALAERERMVM